MNHIELSEANDLDAGPVLIDADSKGEFSDIPLIIQATPVVLVEKNRGEICRTLGIEDGEQTVRQKAAKKQYHPPTVSPLPNPNQNQVPASPPESPVDQKGNETEARRAGKLEAARRKIQKLRKHGVRY